MASRNLSDQPMCWAFEWFIEYVQKCKQLEELVKEVVKETKVEAEVIKITDIQEIAKAGIMLTPGLMIDGRVKFTGKVPSKADLVKLITESAL